MKESVLDDLSRRNIFSEIQKGDKLHFGTDPRNVTIWREKYTEILMRKNYSI